MSEWILQSNIRPFNELISQGSTEMRVDATWTHPEHSDDAFSGDYLAQEEDGLVDGVALQSRLGRILSQKRLDALHVALGELVD